MVNGFCLRLQELEADPKLRGALKLTSVFGIGRSKAYELACRGIRSIEALREQARVRYCSAMFCAQRPLRRG